MTLSACRLFVGAGVSLLHPLLRHSPFARLNAKCIYLPTPARLTSIQRRPPTLFPPSSPCLRLSRHIAFALPFYLRMHLASSTTTTDYDRTGYPSPLPGATRGLSPVPIFVVLVMIRWWQVLASCSTSSNLNIVLYIFNPLPSLLPFNPTLLRTFSRPSPRIPVRNAV